MQFSLIFNDIRLISLRATCFGNKVCLIVISLTLLPRLLINLPLPDDTMNLI
mgnify:CR=1 FL=1